VALSLLVWGLQNAQEPATFLGGIVAGLGFYVYEPGRIAFPIWIVFLLGLALLYRQRFPGRLLLRTAAITTAGFVLVATPIDLRRLIRIDKPALRVGYELQEIGKPDLEDVLARF